MPSKFMHTAAAPLGLGSTAAPGAARGNELATFRLKMLPAADGDCLLLSWGASGPLHHLVVDGGRKGAYAHLRPELEAIALAGEKLTLYVLTHVDADHIEGALAYLADKEAPLLPDQVWFNGFEESVRAQPSGKRSMRQGDDWSKAIAEAQLNKNAGFSRGVVSVDTAPATLEFEGLKISIVSPDTERLRVMGEKWKEYRRQLAREKDGMRGGKRGRPPIVAPIMIEDFIADGETDPEAPNGSSIAFVAEWQGRRVLLAGDAHPEVLEEGLIRLARGEGADRYRVDLLKAAHHGSQRNTSRALIEALECRNLAISTNGNLHGHPDPEAIARFLHFGPKGRKSLWFNYRNARTEPWSDDTTTTRYDYAVHFPIEEAPGVIEIDLLALQPSSACAI